MKGIFIFKKDSILIWLNGDTGWSWKDGKGLHRSNAKNAFYSKSPYLPEAKQALPLF